MEYRALVLAGVVFAAPTWSDDVGVPSDVAVPASVAPATYVAECQDCVSGYTNQGGVDIWWHEYSGETCYPVDIGQGHPDCAQCDPEDDYLCHTDRYGSPFQADSGCQASACHYDGLASTLSPAIRLAVGDGDDELLVRLMNQAPSVTRLNVRAQTIDVHGCGGKLMDRIHIQRRIARRLEELANEAARD